MDQFEIALKVVFIYMSLLYIFAQLRRNAGLVDIAWGPGFVLVAWSLVLTQSVISNTLILIAALVTVWGLRLGWHIGKRNISATEDWRYAQWRKDWGQNFWWRSYLQVFMLQGMMMVIISAPIIISSISTNNRSNQISLIAGLLLWLVGFFFEVVGDWQLARFISDKKAGKTKSNLMTTGLWRYTRHPNYFGEVTQWWGIWILVSTLPYGWVAIVSPITITTLIMFVSGVPLLESKYKEDKEFQEYARHTSKFFPLPPRK